ncbi:hypothetical protein ACOZ4N_00145 (plasmid) [Halorientalis pallida]|uniref:hypothetical protein n=1 Tax=Halorientalis pallida TaxID=2479928 RepID=UPI003C6F45D8
MQTQLEPGDVSVLEIEEDAPSFAEDVFNPGGWVGRLTPEAKIAPYENSSGVQKLDEDQYLKVAREVQDWAEILGGDTISASLPLSADVCLDRYSRIAPVSEALIEQTSAVLAQRPPVEVTHRDRRSRTPQGRIQPENAMRESAKRTGLVASREVRFTHDSLQNRLLVRFHTQLAATMGELSQTHAYYRELFGDQLAYHEQVLEQPVFNELREAALETDFTDPQILQRVRDDADPPFQLIVDLWEAFLQQINLELEIASNFLTALKPLSKTYELWCLRVLVDVLSEATGRKPIQRIQGEYEFPDDVTLYYNQQADSPKTDSPVEEDGLVSQYLEPELGAKRGVPDYAVAQRGTVIWVGDAKYKTEPTLSDHRQLLSYAVDLLPPEGGFTGELLFCHPADQCTGGLVQEYELIERTLHPNHAISSTNDLREHFEDVLIID